MILALASMFGPALSSAQAVNEPPKLGHTMTQAEVTTLLGGKPMTLDHALQMAFLTSRNLKGALIAYDRARGGIREAKSALMPQIGIGAQATQFDRANVGNLLEAQFSAPYCLAVAATSGRATLDQFEPLRTADPEVRRLMSVTHIRTDRVLGRTDYPSLEVLFKGGRRDYLDIPIAKGAPEAPIPDDELEEKALSLLGPALGDERSRQIVQAVWGMEECTDFSEVTRLLALGEEGEV